MAAAIVGALREAFNAGKTRSCEWRIAQLNGVLQLVNENMDDLCSALGEDLHKARYEAILTELNVVRSESAIAINNLKSWMAPEKVPKSMFTMTDSTYIQREPLGVSLIIGAWNYPVQLTLLPLIGAISAGNCVLLKPSEVAKATERILDKLIPKYLDSDCVRVFCGGAAETQALLDTCRFDKIFFTGNGQVARIISLAAARHLTPVTLELGGKSPVFVDESIDLALAARRIMWGKFLNCGQTCIAPDYVLILPALRDQFVENCHLTLKSFYGEDAEKSKDYGRMINERHTTRVSSMLAKSKGQIAVGGRSVVAERFMEPTILIDVDRDDAVMQEEIFGPVLPVLTVRDENEAIQLINERPKPLALYVFSSRTETQRAFSERTSSGGLMFNDTVVHNGIDGLPFGGVGESGCGAYHGRYSFEAFSHRRSVVDKYVGLESLNAIRYPPYVNSRLSLAETLLVTKPGWFLTRWLFGSGTKAITKNN